MRETDLLIIGGTVITLDDRDSIFSPGAIAVKDGRIAAVGDKDDVVRLFKPEKTIEAQDSLIMPGLVNAHTHAAMTCFRGLADDMELLTWLNDFIFPAEAKNVNPELVYWGSLLACAEMIKSGTTTFCDMYIFEQETAEAAKAAGMRCQLGEVLFDFPSPNAKTPKEALSYTQRLLRLWAEDPLVGVIVEPHSLYTCSPSLLKKAKEIADEHGVMLAIHLLENRQEAENLKERLGQDAISYLRQIGLLDDRFLAYHCVVVNDDDMRTLADHGCKVVHNPESNMKLSSGIAPVTAMLRQGIIVGLGTDGCASNNNLDMFQEMDSAAKLQKASLLDPTAMPARTVLRMATIYGARAIGLEKVIGSLEIGKMADISIIGIREPHLTPMYNEYSHLVYAANGADCDTVIINGKVVMEDRTLLTINEEEVISRVERIAVRVRDSLK